MPKSSFRLLKNDQIDYEPLVPCTACGRRWHSICALYNDKVAATAAAPPAGTGGAFVCDNCLYEQGNRRRPELRTTAKSESSDHLGQWCTWVRRIGLLSAEPWLRLTAELGTEKSDPGVL